MYTGYDSVFITDYYVSIFVFNDQRITSQKVQSSLIFHMIGEFASNCTVSNYDEKQYIYVIGIATLSKRGKITKYIY